jgi:hypothetical protein
MTTHNSATPTPGGNDQLPRHTASEGPVTRSQRIAFQIWVISVLLSLVVTLGLYIFDKIYFAFTGR